MEAVFRDHNMAGLETRLEIVLREQLPRVESWRAQVGDPVKDRTGTASNMLAGFLRLQAIGAYRLDHDIERFRSLLRESAILRKSLYDRYDSANPIDESYVSLMGYKALFDSLACGDIQLAERFALKLGGRQQIERKNDHPFTRSIGTALKHVVAQDSEAVKSVSAFKKTCGSNGNAAFVGYATGLDAILALNSTAFTSAIEIVLAAHQSLCSRGRMFDLTPDEVVATWALGLVNLAIARGLVVEVDHQFLPAELISSD